MPFTHMFDCTHARRHGKTGCNLLTWPNLTQNFFDPKQKQVDSWPDSFCEVNPTCDPNNLKIFFFWGIKKKKIKTIFV